MELVVVDKVFAVAVVVLQEDVLVVLLVKAIIELDNGVETEVPALSLHECNSHSVALVATQHLYSVLEYTSVAQNVFVVLSVDDRNPVFSMNHKLRTDVDRAT